MEESIKEKHLKMVKKILVLNENKLNIEKEIELRTKNLKMINSMLESYYEALKKMNIEIEGTI